VIVNCSMQPGAASNGVTGIMAGALAVRPWGPKLKGRQEKIGWRPLCVVSEDELRCDVPPCPVGIRQGESQDLLEHTSVLEANSGFRRTVGFSPPKGRPLDPWPGDHPGWRHPRHRQVPAWMHACVRWVLTHLMVNSTLGVISTRMPSTVVGRSPSDHRSQNGRWHWICIKPSSGKVFHFREGVQWVPWRFRPR